MGIQYADRERNTVLLYYSATMNELTSFLTFKCIYTSTVNLITVERRSNVIDLIVSH